MYSFKRVTHRYVIVRSIKTLHTPVYQTDQLAIKQSLLEGIRLLDDVMNSTSYNKSLLYTGKYRKAPQIITSQDTLKLQNVVREFLDGLQMEQVMSGPRSVDPARKLGKIGLQLFVDCHDRNIIPMSTTLTYILMEQLNKSPGEQTLNGILESLDKVRKFLDHNKVMVESENNIDALVDTLSNTRNDSDIVKRVLDSVDYKLTSSDTVRVVKGKRTVDELEISKGWRFPAGIMDTNEAYLRSLRLSETKLVSIDNEMLILVYDGTLRDANKILPSLTYAAKSKKSLLLIVTGDCLGDALTSITINNNKNMRQGNSSRTIVLKYNSKANNNQSLQENFEFIKFLRLPKGFGSVYSPEFSPYVPSKISADQFYGKLDSLKATTGEAFLYNSTDSDSVIEDNKFLQMTVTVKVGGTSELEIDQRRSFLDNLINNFLCHGLSEGFVPGYGIALAKSIPSVTNTASVGLETQMGIDAVAMALATPMTKAIENVYGYNKYQVTRVVSEAIENPAFMRATLIPSSDELDLAKNGILEPWNKIDKCLANVSNFIRLLNSCKTIVTQVFEKPKKSAS